MMMTKYRGIEIQMGGRVLVIPPLNFRALQQFQDRLSAFTGGIDPQSIQLVLDVAEAALKRNYDDITRDWLSDEIDVGNMQDVMEACMDISGLRRKALEQQRDQEQNPSNGPSSMPI